MQMTDRPALTIVVPVYNGEKYLQQTIKCVLRLTDIHFELLLVDDGSTDKSAAICKAHAAQDARIKYVHQENAGIAAARNLGIKLAAGAYICFLDQDDLFLHAGMAKLLHRIQSEQAHVGMCSTMRMMAGRRDAGAEAVPDGDMWIYEQLHDAVYKDEEVREHLLYPLLFRGYDYLFAASEDYFYGSVWKCIFSLAFVKENGIRFERFVNYEDDWIFVTHALSKAGKVVTSGEAGYCWRAHPDSESHGNRFIPDLPERFEKLDAYVSSYINRCMADAEILEAYRSVTYCDHYVELIKNGAGAPGQSGGAEKAQKEQYRSSVEQYLDRTGYRQHLKARRHLKNSAHRKKLILVIFSIAGIRIAYIISRVYDGLEQRLEKIGWIARLERKRKMSNR